MNAAGACPESGGSKAGEPHPAPSRRAILVRGALIAAVVVAAYLPVSRNGFIWDDDSYLTANPLISSKDGPAAIWLRPLASPQYYPLVFTSFWFEYRLWEYRPMGYHLVNVLLHAASAVLLWRLLVRLGVPGAWLAAAFFGLHPVNVETVAWITERKNVLSGFFSLAAALAYFRFDPADAKPPPSRSWEWWWGALFLFAAALLSKTVAATLPASLLLVAWWKGRRLERATIIPLLPFFLLGLAGGAVTSWMETWHVNARGMAWNFTLVERFVLAGRAFFFYLGKLAWPANLSFVYPRWEIDGADWTQWLCPLAAAGLLLALFFMRRRIGRGPLVATLYFAGTLFPALGFFNVYPMRFSFVADHFQYMATIAPLTLAAAAISRLRHAGRRRIPAASAAMLLLVLLTGLTWRRCLDYRDAETLWTDTLRRNSKAALAYYNLAPIYVNKGERGRAVSLMREGVRTLPDDPHIQEALGRALLADGRPEEAVAAFQRALDLDTGWPMIHANLGLAYGTLGRHREAAGELERAVAILLPLRNDFRVKNDLVETLFQLGLSLTALGMPDDASRRYETALEIDPKHAGAWLNLGSIRAGAGDVEGALDAFRRVLGITPGDPKALNNLGATLSMAGRQEEAVESLGQAIQADPDYAAAHFNLGLAEERRGNMQAAVEAYQRVLAIDPNHPAARERLDALR